MYKKLYHYGFAAYLIMLILSVLLYKERMFFLDTAYNLFHMAKSGRMFLHATREGAFMTQLLPLAGIKLGLSLQSIALLYSVGFVVYFSGCYFICGTLLKRPDFALVILLSSIISIAHTFYYTPSELPQGIAFAMVVIAFGCKAASGKKNAQSAKMVLFIGGIAASAFFHPLVVFVVMFALGYFYLHGSSPLPKRQLLLAAFAFMGTTVYKTVFMRLEYDGHSMSGLKNIIKLFPNYIHLYSNSLFLNNCITMYYWLPVLFVAILFVYTMRKQWIIAGYFFAAFAGYLFMVNVSFPDNSTPMFYRENLLLPLTFFIAIPLVFDIFPVLEYKRLALPLFILLLASGCLRIYFIQDFYASRLAWERSFIADKVDKKLLIHAASVPLEKLTLAWGTPFEFFVIGECEYGKTVSILIDENPERFGWALNKNNVFFTSWQVYSYSELKSRYFHFTDTTTGYSVVK